MSRVNRRKKKRNQKIRIGLGITAIGMAMYFFISAILNTLSFGLNFFTGIYGIAILVCFFFSGMIMSPELNKWKNTKVPLPYEKTKEK